MREKVRIASRPKEVVVPDLDNVRVEEEVAEEQGGPLPPGTDATDEPSVVAEEGELERRE
jgi:hypothetical protein